MLQAEESVPPESLQSELSCEELAQYYLPDVYDNTDKRQASYLESVIN